ncbi:MAG: oligopeptidase B, partial [Bacillota bacterium]
MHKTKLEFPLATKHPHSLEKHGDVRSDDYYWLRDRENPKVIAYLTAENKFTNEVLSPVKSLETKIFNEMKGRIKEDESTVPAKMGEYYYLARYEKGQQYPIYSRKKGSLNAPEEVLLNIPELAQGHNFYESSGPLISPNQQIMAFAADTVGRRFYTMYFKDLKSGKLLPDKIENMSANLVWAADNETVFYSEQHPETLRTEKVYRYSLKTH